MRLFFALWPPREAAGALHDWALRAREATGGRATRAASIHLTLAFLGEIEERRVAELRSISANGEPHSLPIEQARYWARNRIVWAGPSETPQPLQALAGTLAARLQERNFPVEQRPFAAHVTLVRNAQRPGGLAHLPQVDWPVREFVLVRSRLSDGGPRYEVLERFALDDLNRP
jgi:RNA 2',3'-cyclic 3'-phosphodiesterase